MKKGNPGAVRTNQRRARTAMKALSAYEEGSNAECIVDCVTDLLHLARRENLDCDALLRQARSHFEAEVADEEYAA